MKLYEAPGMQKKQQKQEYIIIIRGRVSHSLYLCVALYQGHDLHNDIHPCTINFHNHMQSLTIVQCNPVLTTS